MISIGMFCESVARDSDIDDDEGDGMGTVVAGVDGPGGSGIDLGASGVSGVV